MEEIGAGQRAFDRSFVRSLSRKHIQKRCLARTALAEDGAQLPLAQRKRDVVEGEAVAVALGNVKKIHCRHLTIRR